MKKTPLYNKHIELGAKMVDFAGFEMPVQYEGVNAEHINVRTNAGIFDVSHMGNFMVRGQDAGKFLQFVTSNDITKLQPGKVQYSTFTNENGGIVDDLLVYQTGENEYMLVVNASNIEKDWAHLQNYLTEFEDVQMTNVSEKTAIIAVQGPKSPEIIQKLAEDDVQSMKFYTHINTTLNNIPVLLSTTGYTGEKGFEIYVDADKAIMVWDAVMEAGNENGLKPAGLAARDTLRLEKGFCLYGNDIDETTTPLEAGLGWITKLETGFLGSDKLKKQKEEGLKRKLFGFELTKRGIPRKGYKVLNDVGEVIGKVTSGTMSPVLKKGIGLAYLPTALAEDGKEIFIKIRNKNIKAITKKPPFV